MKSILKQSIISLILIAVYTGLGLLISWMISRNSHETFQNIVTYTGLIVTVIGISFSLKGSPSGSVISRMGSLNSTASSFYENETTIEERKKNPYHKNYKNQNIVHFTHNRVSIALAGILLFVISILM